VCQKQKFLCKFCLSMNTFCKKSFKADKKIYLFFE